MLAQLPLQARVAGPGGVRTLAGDKAAGMVGSVAEVFPEAACQRRGARSCRSVPSRVPKSGRARVAAMPRAIHAMESREASEAKALAV
ncbi:MAG: transposase, partial [Parafannyhessea sp.]|uniref:transposase n=1 Tax=Parafannyhessea sp. TaxID=2847324 RepID=UPI003F031584